MTTNASPESPVPQVWKKGDPEMPLVDRIATTMYVAWHGNASAPFEQQAADVRSEYGRAADAIVDLLCDVGLIIPLAEFQDGSNPDGADDE